MKDLDREIIIAVSDVHLGYGDEDNEPQEPHCNKKAFNKFLEQLKTEIPCDRLVICGDFLDLWRRDLLGVVLENQDTFDWLQKAHENGVKLHFVVGNHDYYIRNFLWNIDPTEDDIEFRKNLLLVEKDNGSNRPKWMFLHGDEFDSIQIEHFYDAFCMSNNFLGNLMEKTYQLWQETVSLFRRLIGIFRKGSYEYKHNFSKLPAELRFSPEETPKDPKNKLDPVNLLKSVNKNAEKLAKKQRAGLIFGHTHSPGLSATGFLLANTGSWVTNPKKNRVSNTFAEIKNGKVNLKKFLYDKDTKTGRVQSW